MSRTLVEILADKYTDKVDNGIAQVYDELWEEWRYVVRSVLEIGVDRGGSIEGWLEFFPDAAIFGIDLRPSGFSHPRYREHVGNATEYSPFKVPLDIVIDDGSHINRDVHKAWNRFWPLVSPGGYYVVEDIQVPQHDPNYPRTPHLFIDYAVANNVEFKIERYNLMWLRKGD